MLRRQGLAARSVSPFFVNHIRHQMTNSARAILIVFSICLVGGGATHVIDIIRGGLFPYLGMPFPINAFWTSLAILDFTAAILLWKRRNLGVLLTTAIMLADVAVNSYASYGLGIAFQSFAPLQAQTLFLGFVLGSFAVVWKSRDFPMPLDGSAIPSNAPR